ncbi:hypothetical protein, variant 2 [Verruconis gallopava]|uniref:Spo7-like protein n=1 Tax=Verruconis gallopava TaxID=253628 RepID=A0A0D2APS0_9PEZI|nr:uncharacterized protein PV09_00640 [Verruconis gallopava]XP_016218561.1 hypothetical protein, variant 1 [Verruconis gallopava]XP_016218562.1 hypothetical protein, variant 2 [Verruconis gallopava]KIW08691.1 hypothetical protein PV09_00640 [Verruconis gallopava]KIW08692.1 hypothetical protein, variant 1 [Verruconis gallopava]KIW08693.1 hypothetical protein, variant 2 [Verruconis gallopava]
MSVHTVDQLVKGAPSPNTSIDLVKKEGGGDSARASPQPADPTALLPSSPPQIYLNLLILEASLRQQYLTLRARKRQHTLVVVGLVLWIAGCFYLQFLRPREDGSGIGGSVYWLVDMAEKVALIGGCVMAVLFWATGQWERGMRWPRKWLGTTNRGLRTMNCKIVIIKGPWWKELLSHLSFLLPMQPSTPGSSYHYVECSPHDKRSAQSGRRSQDWTEEDVAEGGDYVKLLLLPKQFTPDFRENWEIYRAEYWEQENQRRKEIRNRIRARNREIAKQQGGWLWWTGWRGWSNMWGGGPKPGPSQREMTPPHHVHSLVHQASLKDKHRRRSSAVKDRDASHSRSSSRSSVMTNPDTELRERRWSTASTGSTGERRRRSKLIEGADGLNSARTSARPARLTPASSRPSSGSRPGTPNHDLNKRASTLSTSSTISDVSTDAPSTGTVPDPAIKAEPAD